VPEPSITVLDCGDGDAIAPFWSAVLGYDAGRRFGASMVDVNKRGLGDHCWWVMADREGNEFCVAPD
jgi:hypothetical protein